MAPGLRLAALLAGVDRSRLSDHDVVRLMVARDRLVSHRPGGAGCRHRRGDPTLRRRRSHRGVRRPRGRRGVAVDQTAAQHEVAFAHEVTERLPEVGELLGSGRVDVRRARVLADGTAHLSAEAGRRVVMADVADRASELDHRSAAGLAAQAVSGGRPRRHQEAARTRRRGPQGRARSHTRPVPPTCCCWTCHRMWRRRLGNASTSWPAGSPATTGGAWISGAPTSPSTCSPGTASHWVGGWSTSPSICAPCWGWPSTPVSWVGGGRW